MISKIKTIKRNKDSTNEEILGLKNQRDQYNKKVRDLIHKIKELNKQKQQTLKEQKIKFDPSKVEDKIKKLELRIETEALPFEAEKKLMQQIKQLKKLQKESKGLKTLLDESKKLSDELI